MPRGLQTVDVSNFTTDAKFRAWGLANKTAILASGMVQTADTGQVDWTTVTKGTATQTLRGYEIYRFDDSLQGVAPIYIRIGYYTNFTTSGNGMTLQGSIGTGSDGAGNITGFWMSFNGRNWNNSDTSTNNAMKILACHTEGYFMIYNEGYVSGGIFTPGWFLIDRTRDAVTGAPTAEGAMFLGQYQFGSDQPYLRTINFTTGYTSGARSSGTVPAVDVASSNGYLSPYYNFQPDPRLALGIVGHTSNDSPRYATFQADPFNSGTMHTYLTLGAGTNTAGGVLNFAPFGASVLASMANENIQSASVLWED